MLDLSVMVAVSALVAAPRSEVRLDEGWRFHLGDAAGAEAPGYDDSGWRTVDVPHDWSIEDLAPLGAPASTLAVTVGEWRFRKGDDPAWSAADLNDADWQTVTLPAHWESHGVTEDNAYGWFRRRLPVPAEPVGRDVTLALGKVDDVDETFVNGVKVGGMGKFPPEYESTWDKIRRYTVPAGLLRGDGRDVVAVRVFDGQGEGGIYAAAPEPHRSGPFDSESVGGGAVGFTVGGVGWYRLVVEVSAEQAASAVSLEFEGVYMNSEVWWNGERLGGHLYGYTPFRFDLTGKLREGANTVAVRVDATGKTSRWYPGSGIYRHVRVTTTGLAHLDPRSTFVSTPEVSEERAVVEVETTARNEGGADSDARVEWSVLDASGATVATSDAEGLVDGYGVARFLGQLRLERPALWSPEQPSLYTLRTRLTEREGILDETTTSFGVRAIAIDAERGFVLNGAPRKLHGGCVHHDNGPLGSRAYDRAEERRVELLKAAGFDAIRTAHNPPSEAFLAACDRLGMLVLDEAFDCWQRAKNPEDYHRFFDAEWEGDIEAMVVRDRNHPCVFAWSIGNEVVEQGAPEGAEIAGRLAERVRELDPTRPVALGAHPGTNPWENMDPTFAHLDLAGYNYKWERYVEDHERVPERVIVGTETFPVACYDSWRATANSSWVIGDFVWTSFDYLGEVALGHTHYEGKPNWYGTWPWTAAWCGDIDICGRQRPQSLYRQAVWGHPVLALFVETPLPPGETKELVWGWGWPNVQDSWTWPGQEGKSLTVHVYTGWSKVRLELDGRDVGTHDVERCEATWTVPYAVGTLVAVALDPEGKEVARATLRTAGPPAGLRLAPDRVSVAGDGQDLSFVTVELLDAAGTVIANAEDVVRFSIEGPGELAAVANSNPISVESFRQPERKLWRGRALAIVRSAGGAGAIRLHASVEGGPEAAVEIEARP